MLGRVVLARQTWYLSSIGDRGIVLDMAKQASAEYSEEEGLRRSETALRAAFNTPHKTYEESKIRKRKPKPTESPGHRSPVKKSGR
jgi:hypothetical protein